MRVVFRLLAVVALIATIGGEVLQYSDEVLKDLQLTEAYADEMKAEVVNPDAELEFFHRGDELEVDAVYLVPTSTPNEASSGTCGGSIGIKVTDTGVVYCGLDVFGIEVGFLENQKQALQVGLLFQSKSASETARPLILDIPIFIQPSQFAEANKQKEFEDWAAQNKVGIVRPVDSQTLSDILDKKNVKLTFKWLSNLLSLGVSKSKNPLFFGNTEVPLDTFISRPIVLPKDVAEEFVSLIENTQPKEDDFDKD